MTKRTPVKHIADCKACWYPKDGFKTRKKSVCFNCSTYDKCVAKTMDKATIKALRTINKHLDI